MPNAGAISDYIQTLRRQAQEEARIRFERPVGGPALVPDRSDEIRGWVEHRVVELLAVYVEEVADDALNDMATLARVKPLVERWRDLASMPWAKDIAGGISRAADELNTALDPDWRRSGSSLMAEWEFVCSICGHNAGHFRSKVNWGLDAPETPKECRACGGNVWRVRVRLIDVLSVPSTWVNAGNRVSPR